MQPGNRNTDLSAQNEEENLRNIGNENEDELEETSSDLQDETTGEPVLDEEDLEENDLTEEDLDDIEWEEPNNER
jgi:hypothetical protein